MKTIEETIIKASIDGLSPISLAVKANKRRAGIKCKRNFNKTKLTEPIVKVFIKKFI